MQILCAKMQLIRLIYCINLLISTAFWPPVCATTLSIPFHLTLQHILLFGFRTIEYKISIYIILPHNFQLVFIAH